MTGPGGEQPEAWLRGLLFHLAEHAQRHTGQVIATAKAVRGSGLSETAAPPASRG